MVSMVSKKALIKIFFVVSLISPILNSFGDPNLKVSDTTKKYEGVIYPLHEISLSMGVGGIVSSIDVKLGDLVKKGDTLLQLDDLTQEIEENRRKVIYNNQAELESLKERISRTEILMKDMQQLYKESGSVSRDEVLRAELDYFSLQGRYKQLKADKVREELEYQAAVQERKIRTMQAPMSGYLISLDIEKGEWVTPGKELMKLVDTSYGILKLAIPASEAKDLDVGTKVPLKFESYYTNEDLIAEVTFVSVTADPASGLVKIEITFENKNLTIRPGGRGYALLP